MQKTGRPTSRRWGHFLAVLALGLFVPVAAQADEAETLAKTVRKTSGVSAGLIVHYGCGDGALAAALSGGDGVVVHGLARSAASMRKARALLAARGLLGKASVAHHSGNKLPYIDNLVNLFVAEDAGGIPAGEVMRILAPGGVACIRKGGRWTTKVKPRPAEIDDWTHYMHDPGNNAVANDTAIGPPRHLQWLGGPRWARHHDHVASMNAMVTTGGRLFYIMDEGLTASLLTPSKWRLICRDAFNGLVLWKRNLPDWVPALVPLKAGPASLPRRLVAVGETVYAPLGRDKCVSALSAVSGDVLRTYAGSENTEETIVSGDLLLVVFNTKPIITPPTAGALKESEGVRSADPRMTKAPLIRYYWSKIYSHRWASSKRVIRAYRASTGKALWEVPSLVMPLSLAADVKRVYFHDGIKVVALDRGSGKQVYATDPVPVSKDRLMGFFGPTLVVYKDVVIFAGGERIGKAWMGWEYKDQGQDTMTAFSAETGKKLWTSPHPYAGYQSPEDVLVAGGLVWTADTAKGGARGTWIGRDPHTGKVKKEIPPTVKTGWFHHRCYRAKASTKFLLPSRNGIEFIDIAAKTWNINHWVRSGCLYGIMPANGMIYNSPHNCACHPQAKLFGFNALAAASPTRAVPKTADPKGRFEKGPAFAKVSNPKSEIRNPKSDWPIYRGNTQRGGSTPAALGSDLKDAWTVKLAGKLTQPVVSGDLLVTASVDTHTVYALDAASGKERWRHVAGGRIDSSPTLAGGRVVFGSADGYVTCLRASDGALAWRFRAAPVDRRIVVFGQVESAWPVNGSVLVDDGIAYFTAGRSFFLDGGVRFFRLDVKTGEVLTEKIFDNIDYKTGKDLHARASTLDMPVGMPDILGADGEVLFMRSQVMNREGERTTDLQHHLFAPYGFVDDSWFHRAYWVFGKQYYGGCGGYTRAGRQFPSGRMIVHDDKNVYGYGRQQKYYRWITEMEYKLFASPRIAQAPKPPAKGKRPRRRRGGAVKFSWTCEVPILVRAMAKAGETLFIAGPPDLVDEAEAIQLLPDPKASAALVEQEAAYLGEKGAVLWAVSAADGKKLAEYKLDALPAFDGLSIAAGRLYLATETGKLICMKAK